jgi:hypothetical protein
VRVIKEVGRLEQFGRVEAGHVFRTVEPRNSCVATRDGCGAQLGKAIHSLDLNLRGNDGDLVTWTRNHV